VRRVDAGMSVSMALQLGVAFIGAAASWDVTGEAAERVTVVILSFGLRRDRMWELTVEVGAEISYENPGNRCLWGNQGCHW
jgi:hypothetical protein